MTTVTLNLVASLIGRCKGVTGNSALSRVLNGRTFNQGLKSTASAGTSTYASNGFDSSRTLAAGANETLDLRSFTNVLQETAQAMSKVRLFYALHLSTSTASSISVGNSGANAFIPVGCFGGTAAQLPPGGFIIVAIPSAGGQTADATHKDVKVVNNDGSNSASYVIGWWGE